MARRRFSNLCFGLLAAGILLFSSPAHAAETKPRWNPCKPVKYTIDVTGLNMAWANDIHLAFKAASEATGIPVDYAGRWQHGKPHTSSDPVLVYYKDDPAWDTHGGALGYTQMDHNPSGRRIIGGYVIINPDINRTNHATHKRVLYHEVGHVFGLPHSLPQYQPAGRREMPCRSR